MTLDRCDRCDGKDGVVEAVDGGVRHVDPTVCVGVLRAEVTQLQARSSAMSEVAHDGLGMARHLATLVYRLADKLLEERKRGRV